MNNDIYDFSNTGIYKLIEQMQQISRPVVDMINSTAFKTSMQSVIQQCSIHNEIMQTYFRNNTIENLIKPTLELYAQQMKKIYDIIPTIATQNLYNTMASYSNILREINFDNLKLNDNYIVVDEKMQTNIDNICACGDIIKKDLYQIITAAGEGATAANTIKNNLNKD